MQLNLMIIISIPYSRNILLKKLLPCMPCMPIVVAAYLERLHQQQKWLESCINPPPVDRQKYLIAASVQELSYSCSWKDDFALHLSQTNAKQTNNLLQPGPVASVADRLSGHFLTSLRCESCNLLGKAGDLLSQTLHSAHHPCGNLGSTSSSVKIQISLQFA